MGDMRELWVDDRGAILCLDHMGTEAKAAVVADPCKLAISTSSSVWAYLAAEDQAEIETLLGVVPDCEQCAYQRFTAKVRARRMALTA